MKRAKRHLLFVAAFVLTAAFGFASTMVSYADEEPVTIEKLEFTVDVPEGFDAIPEPQETSYDTEAYSYTVSWYEMDYSTGTYNVQSGGLFGPWNTYCAFIEVTNKQGYVFNPAADHVVINGNKIGKSDLVSMTIEENFLTIEWEVSATECRSKKAVESGACGDNAEYTLYSDGLLKITGTGVVDNTSFISSLRDYQTYGVYLQNVEIGDGITGIADDVFVEEMLASVDIPSSTTNISANAFIKPGNSHYDTGSPLIIYGEPGSAAEAYAEGFEGIFVFTDGIYNIGRAEITIPNADSLVYKMDGTVCPDLIVSIGGTQLVKGTDYEVHGGDDSSVGTVSGKVIGKGAYSGEQTFNYDIKPADINNVDIVTWGPQRTYDGTPINQIWSIQDGACSLVEGYDYKVKNENNLNVGTAKLTITGMGNYTGTYIEEYEIVHADIAETWFQDIKTKTYTGKAITPAVITDAVFKEGKDYTVEYKDNIRPGVARIIIRGINNCIGEQILEFKIDKKANTLTAKGKTVTVKYKKAKKKNQTIAAKKAVTVSKAQGKVTYKKVSGNKKITLNSSGKITVKKKIKKGTYKVKVKVTAAGGSYYKALSKNVIVIIKVK